MEFVYFGDKYFNESNGEVGYLVNETLSMRCGWQQVCDAFAAGEDISIRHADVGEIGYLESELAIKQANRQASTGKNLH